MTDNKENPVATEQVGVITTTPEEQVQEKQERETEVVLDPYIYAGGSLGGVSIYTCPRCGALVQQDGGVALHADWHHSMDTAIGVSLQQKNADQ